MVIVLISVIGMIEMAVVGLTKLDHGIIRVPKGEVMLLMMFQMEHMLLAMLILLSEVMGLRMLELDYLLSLIDIGMKYL